MSRKQFTFYESFAKAIVRIRNKKDRCDAYDALVLFALNDVEPDLDKMPDAVAMFFDLVRPTLESSKRKAENGKKGGESSKQTDNTDEANAKQTASKTEAKRKQNTSEKEKEGENEKEGEIEIEKEKENECYTRARRFTPPTVEDVRAYCLERGNGIDAQNFVDFYASKGWKVGSNAMKDWRAAVRTWERRDKDGSARNASGSTAPVQREWNIVYD